MEILFYAFSFIVILSSIGVISSKNPVYSVLWLIFTFLNSSAIFIMLGAEFIAMTIIIVYVGAVAVLFLFVVMMLNINLEEVKTSILSNKIISAALIGLLLLDLCLILNLSFTGGYVIEPESFVHIKPLETTNTHSIGEILYTDFFVIFQISGLILLLAMVGCISLTLRKREGVKKQDPQEQVGRSAQDSLKLYNPKIKEGVDGINYQ